MNIFKSIDDKLNEFAKKHNAGIYTREIRGINEPIDETEIRTIYWSERKFDYAILIFPHTSYGYRTSDLWDITIHSSLVENGDVTGEIPFWTKDLLKGVPFPEIERQIDHLLAESEKLLSAVRVEDMRLDWFYLDGKLVDNRIK